METVAGWKRIAFVLCGVGLFKEFFPSAPFIVEYAIDYGNFTSEEVIREILPATIYGHFVSLLIFLLITDLLRYRPVILLGGLSAVACWSVTIYAYDTKRDAVMRQVLYSIEHSSEVAYITFMYEIVSRAYYKGVTSLVHGSMHAGKFIAGALGQILLSYKILPLNHINHLSFAGSVCVVAFAMFLPGIKWSLYWHPHPEASNKQQIQNTNKDESIETQDGQLTVSSFSSLDLEACNHKHHDPQHCRESSGHQHQNNLGTSKETLVSNSSWSSYWHESIKPRFFSALSELRMDIVRAYSNGYVARWSVWWAMSRAVYWQIGLFTESLWKQIEEETHQHPLNGAVDAAHALISTLIAACLPFIKVPWELWAESYLAVIALIQGCMTLWMSLTRNLYIANICYVIVQTTFEVVFIFGATEIASSLPDHKASFIVGINALCGILIQIVITNIVVTPYSFALDIHQQFFVYGVYSLFLSIIFLSFALRRRHKNWNVQANSSEEGLTKF